MRCWTAAVWSAMSQWKWPIPGGLTTSHSATVTIGEFVCSSEGTFELVTDTTMKASVTGNGSLEVEELLVHEGDYVTSGTPLFRIRSKDVEDILEISGCG